MTAAMMRTQPCLFKQNARHNIIYCRVIYVHLLVIFCFISSEQRGASSCTATEGTDQSASQHVQPGAQISALLLLRPQLRYGWFLWKTNLNIRTNDVDRMHHPVSIDIFALIG